MGNDVGVEERKGQAAANEEASHHDHVEQPSHARGGTKFTSKGPKPEVLQGFKDGSMPSASEMAYDRKKKDEVSIADAQSTALAAADIVQHQRMQEAGRAPARFYKALDLLYQAVTGQKRDDVDLVQMLDAAMVMLEPAIAPLRQSGEWAVWLDEQLMQHVTSARSSARYVRAKDRVENSIRMDGKTVELPRADEPRKQAALLREQIHKLVPNMAFVNEQVIRAAHDGIHHEAEKMLEGETHGHKMGPGVLVQLQSLLWMMDGYLTLTDEEFQHELKNVQGVFNGVATYSELVKAATELLGGSLVITASYGAGIAKLMGDTASMTMLTGVARTTGLFFANVIAGVEIVHGVAVLFDAHASADKRVKAGFEVASGTAWFVGKHVAGAAAGMAASTAVMLGYMELRAMAHLYWGAAVGITAGLMGEAFKTLQRDGADIAITSDKLAKVKDLMQAETNPEQLADLKRVHDNLVHELAGDVDRLIGDCGPRERESGMSQYPGAYAILLEVFAPVRKHKGAKTEEQAVAAATVALERVGWALSHAGELVVASAGNHSLKELEHQIAKQQEHGEE